VASVNFVTAHDGFTLHDLVSYSHKHNEPTRARPGRLRRQPVVETTARGRHRRRRHPGAARQQKAQSVATLLLAQGVPMLLGGDEIGAPAGNNNAYCQDNELSWFDWNLDERRRALLDFTRRMIKLRQQHPRCSGSASSRATSSGSPTRRTWPGCVPTARR